MARSLKVTVTSDPFIGDPPTAGEFYEAVGRYVRVWSHVENHFNSTLLLMLYHPASAVSDLGRIEDGLVSFKKRVDMWRRLVARVPHFQRIKKGATTFADRMTEANHDRNRALHRAWRGFTSADPLTVKASSWRRKKGELLVEEHQMSLPQLREMTERADALNTRLLPITLWVSASYPKPQASRKSSPPREEP